MRAGQYLGDESDVGCAMLAHLHFAVAVAPGGRPIDEGGFVTGNEGSPQPSAPVLCP